ncbi:hypothetical protein ABEB36_009382 [Hypothenemus hampei]|uniref:Uncharacterized protein n=1 Tax=Hypothenemus hampei TaxID=57062 RepID=A0ABD1EGU4_HYPHA
MQLLLIQTLESNSLYVDKIKYLENELSIPNSKDAHTEITVVKKIPSADGSRNDYSLSVPTTDPCSRSSVQGPSTSSTAWAAKYSTVTAGGSRRGSKSRPSESAAVSDSNRDDNDFTLVTNRKRRPPVKFRPPVVGLSTGDDAESDAPVFVSTPRKKWLHISRDVKCFVLTDKEDVCSFKVCLNDTDLTVFLDPNLWPKGVAVREFITSRKKAVPDNQSVANNVVDGNF